MTLTPSPEQQLLASTTTAQQRHIEELQKQRDALLVENAKLAETVALIPRIILEARLDAKAGKPTIWPK